MCVALDAYSVTPRFDSVFVFVRSSAHSASARRFCLVLFVPSRASSFFGNPECIRSELAAHCGCDAKAKVSQPASAGGIKASAPIAVHGPGTPFLLTLCHSSLFDSFHPKKSSPFYLARSAASVRAYAMHIPWIPWLAAAGRVEVYAPQTLHHHRLPAVLRFIFGFPVSEIRIHVFGCRADCRRALRFSNHCAPCAVCCTSSSSWLAGCTVV